MELTINQQFINKIARLGKCLSKGILPNLWFGAIFQIVDQFQGFDGRKSIKQIWAQASSSFNDVQILVQSNNISFYEELKCAIIQYLNFL